jgi:hypothetical protein
MFNIKLSQQYSLRLGLTVALITAITAPVSAQQVIVIDNGGFSRINQQPTVGNFIYGSSIPTPIPVDPSTGLTPNRTHNLYPQLYPQVRQNIRDTVLVNPVLVNPKIRNSTLINPVIVRDSWYSTPIHQPTIITHPW